MGCTTSKAVPVGEDTSYGEHTKKVGNGKHQASQPADGANTSTAGKDGETPDIVPLEQHNGDAETAESENKGIQEEVIQAAASTDVQSSPVPSAFADGEAANTSIQVAEDNWVMVNKTEDASAVEASAADGDASISGPVADAQDTSAVLHISEEQDDQLSPASPEDQIRDASVVSHGAAEVSTSAQKEDVEDKPLPTIATPVPSVPTEATTALSVPSEVTTVPAMPTEATTISSFSNEVAATESATSIVAAEASTTEVTSAEPASVPVDEAATTVEVQETVCTEPTSSDVDPQQSELASKSDEALPEESQPATDKQDQEASTSNTEAVAETASESEQKGDVETVGEKIVQEVIAEAVRQVETSPVQNDDQAAVDHSDNQEHHDASLSDEEKAKAAIKIQAGLRGMRDRKYVKALKSQEEHVNHDHVTEQATPNGVHETDDTAAGQPEDETTPAVAE